MRGQLHIFHQREQAADRGDGDIRDGVRLRKSVGL